MVTTSDPHEPSHAGGDARENDPSVDATSPDRVVALHFHLFKNAGTSLDAAFQDALEEGRWVTREFGGAPETKRRDAAEWIADHPQARCFSSHTALLPAPVVEGATVVPVIFLRHPLDRIASAYAFESRQGASTFGSVLARNTTLAGYVETRLSIPADHQCRDFHARRLADAYPATSGDLAERAFRALDELPFVGSVENYAASLERLREVLREKGFGDVELLNREKNASRGRARSLERKLEDMRASLGPALFGELESENATDLELHARLQARFAQETSDAA